jgi:hypothetical protein
LAGQWQFAYVGKTHSRFGQMPPPRFDRIGIQPPSVANLMSSVAKQNFRGVYEISGKSIAFEFIAPGIDQTIRHELDFTLAEGGKTLILARDGTEMVYFHPDRFLPNDLAGDWRAGTGKNADIMRLGRNGSISLSQSGTKGQYCLWNSAFGKTMTAILSTPGHGTSLMLWKCDEEGNELTLTPIFWKGPKPGEATTWTWRNGKRPPPSGGEQR